MKNLLFFVFVFVFVFCINQNLIAGPLGLDKGLTFEQIKKLGNFSETKYKYRYSATSLKNGYMDAYWYTAIITPKNGLCKIDILTKFINVNSFGTELQSRFGDIKDALSKKYGPPSDVKDFLRSGSIWNEQRDWMMGLWKQERVLTAYWNAEKVGLPDSLKFIAVEAIPISSQKGYISFGYEFDNISECWEEIEALKNSNL